VQEMPVQSMITSPSANDIISAKKNGATSIKVRSSDIILVLDLERDLAFILRSRVSRGVEVALVFIESTCPLTVVSTLRGLTCWTNQ